MTIAKARDLLGDLVVHLTDEELEEFVNQTKRMALIVLDFVEREKRD